MKKGKNERRITLGQQIIVAMLIMQSAVMAFLSGMVVAGITKNTRAEAIDNMEKRFLPPIAEPAKSFL